MPPTIVGDIRVFGKRHTYIQCIYSVYIRYICIYTQLAACHRPPLLHRCAAAPPPPAPHHRRRRLHRRAADHSRLFHSPTGHHPSYDPCEDSRQHSGSALCSGGEGSGEDSLTDSGGGKGGDGGSGLLVQRVHVLSLKSTWDLPLLSCGPP